MTRLPNPGSDSGTWGTILNNFLRVEHNSDGTLKRSGDITTALQTAQSAYEKPSSGIPSSDLSSSVQTSLTKADNAPTTLGQLTDVTTGGATNSQVLSYNSGTSKWTPATVSSTVINDASASTKGILQLSGDLTGTANSPAIANGAITSAKIANSTIIDSNISSSANIAQNKIANLASDLSSKADDTAVVHTTGTETITGAKDFTGGITVNGTNIIVATDARLTDNRTPLDNSVSVGKISSNNPASSGNVLTYNGTTLTWQTPTSAVNSVNSKTGTVTLTASDVGAVSATGGGKETSATPTASGASTTVDLGNGNVQLLTLSASTTISLAGATAGVACSLSLYIQQDATGSRLITWPGSIKWPGGAAPTLSTGANKIDLIVLETLDGGTTWYGSLAGADFR